MILSIIHNLGKSKNQFSNADDMKTHSILIAANYFNENIHIIISLNMLSVLIYKAFSLKDASKYKPIA